MTATDRRPPPGSGLHEALAAARIGSWTFDLSTGELESSTTCKANFGRGPHDPFTYDDLASSILEEDRHGWRQDVERVLRGASALETEYRTRWPDGSVHWILVRGTCRLDAEGHVVGLVGVSIDVTSRKLSEQALLRAEGRQRFLAVLNEALRSIDDAEAIEATATAILGKQLGVARAAYFEVDHDHYVVNRNYVDGVRTLTGRFPIAANEGRLWRQYSIGRPVRSDDVTTDPLLIPHEREQYLAFDIQAYLGVPVVKSGAVVGGLVVQSDRPRRWSDEDLALVEETAERTWAAAERARATRSLNESRARFELVRQAAEVGFWFCDLPFDVLVWDARVKQHFWLPADTHVTIDTFYERLHPDDREPTRTAIAESIALQLPYDVAYRTVSPQGEAKWIRAIGRTYFDEAGVPFRFDGVTLDITAQRLAEEALRENDRRKDEFLAMLAHELRNPLAPIVTATQLLKHTDGDPSVHLRARGVIERQVQHLTKLVDDLLDVSRITQRKITLRCEPLEVATVVARAIEASRPLVDARRQQLTVNMSNEALWVNGDLTRLVQVLSNLLNNAAKYTDEGGAIALDVAREADEIVIRVADNGIGIEADLLSSVFDLFTQADHSLDRAQGGLGLGLRLVRLLVEMHHGRVEARSGGSGHGSEFIVRLPALALETAALATAAAQAISGPARGMKVLVVEDHRDTADMLAAVLRRNGHDVQVSHDGASAIAAAVPFKPDVVLCDIGLPAMNGYAVADALRADGRFANTMLVAISGYGKEEDRRRSEVAGFRCHLVKPVDPQTILEILSSWQIPGSQTNRNR